jgi:putative transposase
MDKILYHPEFVTATIYEWYPLLKENTYKQIILDSLKFLVEDNRIILYAYCIMDTHIHLIWQVKGDHTSSSVRRDFFKFTAHQFKRSLLDSEPEKLSYFLSTQSDRTFQFWERNTLCIELFTDKVFDQKLDYIHFNPVTAGICDMPEDYLYSSASFYLNGKNECGILTHSNG